MLANIYLIRPWEIYFRGGVGNVSPTAQKIERFS